MVTGMLVETFKLFFFEDKLVKGIDFHLQDFIKVNFFSFSLNEEQHGLGHKVRPVCKEPCLNSLIHVQNCHRRDSDTNFHFVGTATNVKGEGTSHGVLLFPFFLRCHTIVEQLRYINVAVVG